MFLSQRNHILRVFASIVLMLAVFLPTGIANAEPYGSGSYNSCNYNQTNCPTSSGSSSSSSSGSSTSTSPKTSTSSSILLNDYGQYFTDAGKTLDLKAGQVINFEVELSDGNLQKHTITISEVGKDFVTFVIDSSPETTRLSLDQTGKYDVNADGQEDIAITLNSIANEKANMTFLALSQAPKTTSSTTTPNTAVVTTSSQRNWWPIVLSALAVVFGLWWFIWFFLFRRKRQI